MTIGTKSILFGGHQFAIHPWFVAAAWWRIYGFPCDMRLWVAFFVHDLGYWGKPNMDGEEGEQHPEFGACLMHRWFDGGNVWLASEDDNADLWDVKPIKSSSGWYRFTKYHSRFLAKRDSVQFSKLCVADKLAIAIIPRWIYLLQTNLTGEIHEYMRGQGARTPAGERTQWQWITDVQAYCRAWAYEHRDMKFDGWTGTKRDMARCEEKAEG